MMRRSLVGLIFILGLLSMAGAMDANNYKLDLIRSSGYSTFSESSNYSRLAFLSNSVKTLSDATYDASKYTTFALMDVSALTSAMPTIVSMSIQPQWVKIGSVVTIDLTLSEAVRNWSIQIDGVQQLNTNYDLAGHLEIFFQPTIAGEKKYILNVDLVDMGGNIAPSTLSFNVYVDDGERKISHALVTENMSEDVHKGRRNSPVIVFDLMAVRTPYIMDGITLNIANSGVGLFDRVSLVRATDHQVIASVSIFPDNQDFFLPLIPSTILTTANVRYELQFDVKESATIGSTFSVDIVSLLAHQTVGIQDPFSTSCSMLSGVMEVIPIDQPIAYIAKLERFQPAIDHITVDIQAQILDGQVNQVQFHLQDLTSGNTLPTMTQPASAVYISNNRYSMDSRALASLQLTHNHQYVVVLQLVGTKTSDPVSSSAFIVDTTPPVKPNSLQVQTYAINSHAGSMAASSSPATGISFVVDTRQWLDPESGLQEYKIIRKSSTNPVWQTIVSSNTLTANTIQVNYEEGSNALYYYALAVKNRAGLWSEQSDVKEVDLRSSGLLIDTLFNSPNPFDSRLQSTTIYYSLLNNADVDLYLYDMYGYLVRKWHFQAGAVGGQMSNSLDWDATNQLGDKVSMGGYIFIMKAKDANGNTMQKKYSIGVMR